MATSGIWPAEVITLRGEQIAYRRAGAGPAVLLVHSLGTSSAIWTSTMAALAGTHAVVAMDCRGHGSSSNRGGFTLDDVARDGLALMSMLGFEHFAYVGISMGGLIGVTLNAIDPTRTSAMVLADSYATVGAAGLARLQATRAALAEHSMAEFAEAYVAQTLRAQTPADTRKMTARLIASMKPEDYLQTVEAILMGDASRALGLIGCPTLVLLGEEDQRTPLAMSQQLVEGIRGAELRVVPRAAHLAVLDNPVCFDAEVAGFLTRADA